MKLFALVAGGREIPSRDAANAIALLHPITDEALDKGQVSPASVAKLSRFLDDGIWPQIETKYEEILFGLLGFIHRDFPAAAHPWLHSMLKRLHHAQLRSLAQQGHLDSDALIDLTFEKGGLSTAIAGYLALGGLTSSRYEFFFKAGAIFQIMDDLLDIEIDLREGGLTVWTGPVAAGQSLAPALGRFLAVEDHFEAQLERLTADFGGESPFARIYAFAFQLTLMRGLARHPRHFSRRETGWIRRYFPVSFFTLGHLIGLTETGHELLPEDLREIIRASEAY